MNTTDRVFDDDAADNDWPALGWIVMAALVAVVAFLLAPMP